MIDRMLTIAEVSAALRVSERTLFRWRAVSIGPPCSLIVGSVRYSATGLEKWISEQEVGPDGNAEEEALQSR